MYAVKWNYIEARWKHIDGFINKNIYAARWNYIDAKWNYIDGIIARWIDRIISTRR